eukprot:4455884-Amphidinium_carterae.1
MAKHAEAKGPLEYAMASVVEAFNQWSCKKVVVRVDGEPTIVSLMDAVKKYKFEHVLEMRPKYSPQSLGPAHNANKELNSTLKL